MKFDLWMLASIAVLIITVSFPDLVPFIVKLYGVIFLLIMFVTESILFLKELEREEEIEDGE